MKTYRGTEQGPDGVYLNLSTGEFTQLHEKPRVLPGSSEVKHIKVPSVLAIIISPLVGLAFIIFLPFVGIAGIIGFLGYKLWHGILAMQRGTIRLVAIAGIQEKPTSHSKVAPIVRSQQQKPKKN